MLELINNVEGNKVWKDEKGFILKENHTEEDKLKKLMYSQNYEHIKFAMKAIEQAVKNKTKEYDLYYLFDMQRIEPGIFKMGEKKTRTEIKEAFYLCKFVCTQGLWLAIMDENPAAHQGDLRLPIENVSFEEVEKFINKLIEVTGLPFRLPKEKEWEYAADGGHCMPKDKNGEAIEDIYGGFNDIKDIDDYAWYAGNSDNHTHPVGEKKPNKCGLYDITGNVFEWVIDED